MEVVNMAVDDFVPETGVEELDLGVDLETVPPQHAVPAGEHLLTLVDCEVRQQKADKGSGKFIIAQLEVSSDPDAKLISHVMMLPAASDKERKVKNRLRNIGDFYKTFSIPSSGPVKFSDYLGNQGWATLTIENSTEYGDQNRIGRFIPKK
jgi:hypothetical protein